MNRLNKEMTSKKERPIRVMQFGEGNFLRAFVDYMIDIANEKGMFDGSIVLVKPIPYGSLECFHEQDCCYTVSLRGLVNGEKSEENRIINSVADAVGAEEDYETYMEYGLLPSLRFIVSNTTEAGIVYDETDCFDAKPPKSYPGKLTKLLYMRYQKFEGDQSKGLIILPVELIDNNGEQLKQCVMKLSKRWNLEDEFLDWLQESCVFCSTLVDRIVTGYPKEPGEDQVLWKQFGYEDRLLVTAEPFGLWVIESERDIRDELPLDKAGLPVIFTDNQKPYKQRKVRILNGAHTSFVPAAFLCGKHYVLEAMEDETISSFMEKTIYQEVIPTLSLPKEDLLSFAGAVKDRFHNPYIRHALLSIALNSVSKWRARCMPSFLEYIRIEGKLPVHLTFSLAALIAFYRKGEELVDHALIGHLGDEEFRIMDDIEVLEFFLEHRNQNNEELSKAVLGNCSFWGQDLTLMEGVAKAVENYLNIIEQQGMPAALNLLEEA